MSNSNVSNWYNGQHKSTLKECSYDSDNKEYMISSDLESINFDGLKDKICQNSVCIKSLKSVDALYLHTEQHHLYLIEFKNGNIEKKVGSKYDNSKLKIMNIKEKIYDSYLILKHKDILNFTDIKLNFILVYNPEKNPDSKVNLSDHLARRSKRNFVRFGLNKFKGYLYNDVFTMTPDIFEKFIKNDFTIS